MAQNTRTRPTVNAGLPAWIDWILLAVIVLIAVFSFGYTLHTGAFDVPFTASADWIWYLVRSAGMTAYGLLAASMVWGIFLSSHLLKNWSTGPLALALHAATSWLAVVLSIAHALLLLLNTYYTYALRDLVVPFVGPYRPFAVGLGVIAFWLTLAVTVSFALRKLIGRRSWLWLHYTSYGAFALVTVHAILAGTDAMQPGVRLVFFGFGASVFVLFAIRVVKSLVEQTREADRV